VTKNTTKPLLLLLFCVTPLLGLLSSTTNASELKKIPIEVIENAKVFARFDDKIPAVVNYFTKDNEQTIVAFYDDKYGKAASSERIKDRLEMSYVNNNYRVKIIISEQNNFRQVDMLVTQ